MISSCLLRSVCLSLLLLPLSPTLSAVECRASSGPQRVALLELYTSEGCSSCPPADRWVSQLSAQGFAADRVIPLVLHVDYWDHIGWRDRFANPTYSARQRDMAKRAGLGVVYTPQVTINGRDFPRWSSATSFVQQIADNKQTARANIEVNLSRRAPDRWDASVSVSGQKEDLVLSVVLYENDLWSAVTTGENAGRRLRHDYVVREWRGPSRVGSVPWVQTLQLKPEWQSAKMGIVVFVQNPASGEVVQAMTIKMCG